LLALLLLFLLLPLLPLLLMIQFLVAAVGTLISLAKRRSSITFVQRRLCSQRKFHRDADVGLGEIVAHWPAMRLVWWLPAAAAAAFQQKNHRSGQRRQSRPGRFFALNLHEPFAVLEASPLNVIWHFSGGAVASGNDGWCTNFLAAMTPVEPKLRSQFSSSICHSSDSHGEQAFDELPSSGCLRWELEISQLDGWLANGVCDGMMLDNAFLGDESRGSWVGCACRHRESATLAAGSFSGEASLPKLHLSSFWNA